MSRISILLVNNLYKLYSAMKRPSGSGVQHSAGKEIMHACPPSPPRYIRPEPPLTQRSLLVWRLFSLLPFSLLLLLSSPSLGPQGIGSIGWFGVGGT